MSAEPMNAKQAALIIAVAVILWVPMLSFILFFSDSYSPRQIAAIGAVNMLIGVPLLIVIYRRWIRTVR
jgi:hypothetical protein